MLRVTIIALAMLVGFDQIMLGGRFTAAGERAVVSFLRHAR
jgi:hypothetical protein